jgi:electron transfer flavoprotein alpha subunit
MLERYDITVHSPDGVIVWAETDGNDVERCITEAAKKAIGKAKELNLGRVFGIIFGQKEIRPLYDEAFAYGVDTLYHFRSKGPADDAEMYADAFEEVRGRVYPMLIIIPSTERGKRVAASLSAAFDMEVNECTDIRRTGNAFVFICGGRDKEVAGRSAALVSLDTDHLPAPEKAEGRKGTAVIRPFP